MTEENRTLLTLEERLRLAAKSQAASPESAAKMVQRLGKAYTPHFFCTRANMQSMYDLVGEFMERLDGELFRYGGFCQSFCMAMDYGGPSGLSMLQVPDPEYLPPYDPIWGFQASNAIVLLGLMLLDHAKGRMKYKDIYHCMRMTLKQYLDALVDTSFREDGTLDQRRAEEYRIWRNVFLQDYDGSAPLGEALAEILRRYIAGWQEFDRLDRILCRIESISEDCTDLACEDPKEVPDPGSDDVVQGSLYNRIMLAERDYRPHSLRAQGAGAPSPEVRELLEKHICEERLASAMREVNIAVSDLYVLCAEPYLRMQEYHYEKHLE